MSHFRANPDQDHLGSQQARRLDDLQQPACHLDIDQGKVKHFGLSEVGVQTIRRAHAVLRLIDDPNYVMIDLDFDSASDAEAFLAMMREVWRSATAAPALIGSPQARIVEVVESKQYQF